MSLNSNNSTLLVFPTSRAIRSFVQKSKHSNQLLPKTITIGDFFSKVILIKDKEFCEVEHRILYLKQALHNIDIKNLGMNKDFNSLLKQSDYLFSFFSELTHENKTIDDLYEVDTYAYYHDHLDILKKIYEQYCLILKQNNIVDKITLPKEYKLNELYVKQFENIVVYYEGYFSSFEFELIQKISKLTNLNIIYTQNDFNTKNIDMFVSLDLEVKPLNKYNINLSQNCIEEIIELKPKNQKINIESISSRINQIGFIKHSIVNMINNGIDASKIVVLLPDESFHESLALFDNEKYFNFAMGQNIKESLMIKVANAIYKILLDFEPKDKDKLTRYNLDYEMLVKDFGVNLQKQLNKIVYNKLILLILSYETRKEVLKKIEIVLYSLEKLLFHKSVNISFKDAFKILLQKLSSITLDDVSGGKITVMGLLETRGISFDGVIVVDFNDHIIPKRSVKDKFISTSVKKLVGLPTLKDREDLQKYYYAELFFNAKMINIAYVQDEQSGLSRFAHEIFPKTIIKKNTKPFENILYNTKTIKSIDKDIILDINLSSKSWSATSLKSYLLCKRQYYFKYIKNIKEHKVSIKPQGFELGSIIHNSLEQLFKDPSWKDDINSCINKLNTIIDTKVGKNSYLILDAQIFKRKLVKFIHNEFNRLNIGTQIIALEQPFKFKYNGLEIKGSIDRIDRLNDNSLLVLDYKTSSSLKIDSVKNYEKSSDFQLEFYYLAMIENFVTQNEQVNCAYYDLNDSKIKDETALNEKLILLDKIFDQLKTTKVDFNKCEDKATCEYCAYKIMCGR